MQRTIPESMQPTIGQLFALAAAAAGIRAQSYRVGRVRDGEKALTNDGCGVTE
jgi:hypothetical protein